MDNPETRWGRCMQSFTDTDRAELEEETRITKTKVDCICPKCGKLHSLNFYWTGKGIPRKYCQGMQKQFFRVTTIPGSIQAETTRPKPSLFYMDCITRFFVYGIYFFPCHDPNPETASWSDRSLQ